MSEVAAVAPSTPTAAPETTAPEAAEENKSEQQQPVAAPVAKKKFKYKADGAEVEEELDDNEIGNRLSLAKAAQKRMQEASTTKRQMDNFIKALKEDPMSVLSNPQVMGNEKFQEIAEAFLSRKLEEQMLTPEQRAQKAMEEKLSKYEAEEKKRTEAAEAQKAQQLQEHYTKQFETTIMTALQSSALPKNAFTVKRMAELMQKNIQHGLDLEPAQLAQLVKEDYQSEIRALVGGADPESMLAMLGGEVADKIRKHDLSKFQVKNPEPKPSQNQPKTEQRERMSPREYTEYLKSKFAK